MLQILLLGEEGDANFGVKADQGGDEYHGEFNFSVDVKVVVQGKRRADNQTNGQYYDRIAATVADIKPLRPYDEVHNYLQEIDAVGLLFCGVDFMVFRFYLHALPLKHRLLDSKTSTTTSIWRVA